MHIIFPNLTFSPAFGNYFFIYSSKPSTKFQEGDRFF
jgi:hypothetical protein